MSLSDQIKSARTGLGLTQEQVARRLGITHQAVSNWENGHSVPTPANLTAISGILGISASDLSTLAEQAVTWKTGGGAARARAKSSGNVSPAAASHTSPSSVSRAPGDSLVSTIIAAIKRKFL